MLSSILLSLGRLRPNYFLSNLLSNIISLYHGMVTVLFNVVTDELGSNPDQRYVWRTALYT